MKFKLWNKNIFIGLCLFCIFFISCSKQKAPKLEQTEVKETREIQRLEACSNVNFNKGVLLYNNVRNLFVCTKWNEQYPNMFQSINKISSVSWDQIMAPVDASFIANQQRRDRVFKNIKDLDSKNGLNDLSYVIVALNETNFFDSMNALFKCVDNPVDPICLSRLGRIPDRKVLKNIIHLIDISPENIETSSQLVKTLVRSLNGHQEDLRTEINKFRASPLFVPARLMLIDALASKVKAGFSEEDREFLSKVLLTESQNANTSWIYSWFQDAKLTKEKFRDLVEYPVLANPLFVDEIKKLKQAYDDGLSCSIKNPSSPNNLIDFDFKTHLGAYADVIKSRTYKGFYDYTAADVVGLKISTEICKELEDSKYKVSFINVLTHFGQFVSEKKYYDLVKFLITETTAKGDLDKTFAENLYLFDMVTGDIFSSANALNSNIISSTRTFYPLVYDIAKTIPENSFLQIGELSKSMGLLENDPKFQGVAAFWSFFTPEEKNFLFNFVDRHFDNKVNYVLLFDFYSKFLDELKDVQPVMKDSWIGTPEKEEMSYLALQDVLSNFSGKETLLDFKKFFSRDQILKVLEIISNGQQINKLAVSSLQDMKSDNYIIQSRSERYKFSYTPSPDLDYDSKTVLECMQNIGDLQNGMYQLVRNLPAVCSKMTDQNIAFRLYGWLNAVEENYLRFKPSPDSTSSLFDKNGILSPIMINNSLALSKILDNLIGEVGSSVPTKNGIQYLFTSTSYYLNQKAAAPLVDKNLDWINMLLNIDPDQNQEIRNYLIKTFTREDNFNYSKNFFANLGKLLIDYGSWIKSGAFAKAQTRDIGMYDANFDCIKVVNQVVAPNPCPTKEVVKSLGAHIIETMQTKRDDFDTAIALTIKGIKSGGGLDIPLNGRNTRKIRLSLRDMFRNFYDTSDKSFDINKVNIKYVGPNKTTTENLTTLERIETVIREVRFDNNYLGVAFLNTVVHGNDYNSDVAGRKKLLSTCLKIPGIRCSRKMSSDDLRMANNSLAVYDALLDANNGRGLDSRLQYGDFLKAFEMTFVGSSGYEAQKVQLLPLKDEYLKQHNGTILTDLTMMSALSNIARVIRDRVGRTRADFTNFIESEDFKRVDRNLLYGFDLPSTTKTAESLLRKLNLKTSPGTSSLFETSVDWAASLDYNQTRLVEDTMARLAVIGSYLGSPEVVFNKAGPEELSKRYGNNNLFQIFLALDKLIDNWKIINNYFPVNSLLIDAIKPINTALYFITTKLGSEKDPSKNTAYLALNDIFLVLQATLFDDVSSNVKGLDLLVDITKDSAAISKTYPLIKDDYHFVDILHENNGNWFSSVGLNLIRVSNSAQVDFNPLRNYLNFTTKRQIELANTPNIANYHYDEPTNLIRYLNKKFDSTHTNFDILNQKLFVENIDQVLAMIDDLLPCIKIKEVKPPLKLN